LGSFVKLYLFTTLREIFTVIKWPSLPKGVGKLAPKNAYDIDPGWNGVQETNALAYFGLVISNEDKKVL
jgi:hypothetical protein